MMQWTHFTIHMATDIICSSIISFSDQNIFLSGDQPSSPFSSKSPSPSPSTNVQRGSMHTAIPSFTQNRRKTAKVGNMWCLQYCIRCYNCQHHPHRPVSDRRSKQHQENHGSHCCRDDCLYSHRRTARDILIFYQEVRSGGLILPEPHILE